MPRTKTDLSINMLGFKIGYLEVIGVGEKIGKSRKKHWKCRCICGKEWSVRGCTLRRGKTVSCGCKVNVTHGLTNNKEVLKEYRCWIGIRQRCENKNNHNYHYYGGRGIKVCKRWQVFENFLEDMGKSPIGYSIERINNDGDYCPNNCKWATAKEQINNRRPYIKSNLGANKMSVQIGNPDFLAYFKEKFPPRELQKTALNWLSENWGKKKYLLLCSPPATGKSAIGRAIDRYNTAQELTTASITPQKSLQNQLQRDYPEVNLLMGKTNYQCMRYASDKHFTCEIASQLGLCKGCKYMEGCPYFVAKSRCYSESVTFFNPLSYLYLVKKVMEDAGLVSVYDADTIIIDEVQSVSSMLSGIFDVKIWRHEHKYDLNISASIPAVVSMLGVYEQTLRTLFTSDLKIEEKVRIQQTITKIDYIQRGLKLEAQNFVVEEAVEKFRGIDTECLKIRVISPPKWILNWFFGDVKHIVLMSGTIFQSTIDEFKMEKDYDILYLPSPIPPVNRQFIPVSAVNNVYNNKAAVSQVATAILELIQLHPNERGIVLASYEQAKQLKGFLQDNPRFIFHDRETKGKVIEAFCRGESAPDAIAVLSGAWEGLDLKDDLCRFVILTKCLYPNKNDKVVIRRVDVFPGSYQMDTMETIIQGANRATRHETDRSVVYMLDSNFSGLYCRTKALLPQYFIETVKFGQTIKKLLEKAGLV